MEMWKGTSASALDRKGGSREGGHVPSLPVGNTNDRSLVDMAASNVV
jgi:hypothetical protein